MWVQSANHMDGDLTNEEVIAVDQDFLVHARDGKGRFIKQLGEHSARPVITKGRTQRPEEKEAV